jgi:hypothetical protein
VNYISSSTWKINEEVSLTVKYGEFKSFKKAITYAKHEHQDLFYFPDDRALYLVLADQALIPIEDQQCEFSHTKPKSANPANNKFSIRKIVELEQFNRISPRLSFTAVETVA